MTNSAAFLFKDGCFFVRAGSLLVKHKELVLSQALAPD